MVVFLCSETAATMTGAALSMGIGGWVATSAIRSQAERMTERLCVTNDFLLSPLFTAE